MDSKKERKKPTMTIEDIPRVMLEELEVEPEVESLAKKAEKLLGYSVLSREIKRTPLRQALIDLEIEVLEEEAVREYQATLGSVRNFDDDDEEEEDGEMEMVWVSTPLRHFRSQVPEFVLRKAVQIKEKVPQADFFVEHLSKMKVNPDPFLVVCLGEEDDEGYSEQYIVEVWAEPGFEFLSHGQKKARQ